MEVACTHLRMEMALIQSFPGTVVCYQAAAQKKSKIHSDLEKQSEGKL